MQVILLFLSQPGRRFSPWPPEGARKVVRPTSALPFPLAASLHPASALMYLKVPMDRNLKVPSI